MADQHLSEDDKKRVKAWVAHYAALGIPISREMLRAIVTARPVDLRTRVTYEQEEDDAGY